MSVQKIRAFIAAYPSRDATLKLGKYCAQLKKEIPDSSLRWLPRNNWHITLKFLGNINAEELEHLDQHLKTWVKGQGAATIHLTRISFFPNKKRPSVLAALSEHNDRLSDLVSSLNALVSQVGIIDESKHFRPHLSLARFRTNISRETLRGLPLSIEPITLTINKIYMVKSQTLTSGAIYSKLASYPLLT